MPPLDKLVEDPVRRDGSVMQYSNFHFEQTVEEVFVIHKKKNLQPPFSWFSVARGRHARQDMERIEVVGLQESQRQGRGNNNNNNN